MIDLAVFVEPPANCNSFHEMEMTDQQLIGSGNWRDTWIGESDGNKVIVKTIK